MIIEIQAHLRRSQAGESDTRVASGVILLTKHITKMKDIEPSEKYTYRLLYGEKSINIVELSNDLFG